MSILTVEIDQRLAAAIRLETVGWPEAWNRPEAVATVIERIGYHGVAGLLTDSTATLPAWPGEVLAAVRRQAMSQAMWELRHRQVLGDLLGALAAEAIVAILLKGTAVAYDLYPRPAARARGDTDLLIERHQLEEARSVLRRLGFQDHAGDGTPEALALQETWTLPCEDSTRHDIDLHWQLLNAPALRDVLPYAECAAELRSLRRLSDPARTMDRARTLLHTCVHRMLHVTSPYMVGGTIYYGGDRLIWLHDIHLLANALTPAEWAGFCRLAEQKGVAAVCLEGLISAERALHTAIPRVVRDSLAAAPANAAPSAYLLRARQFGRAWRDWKAVPGAGPKLSYLIARTLPSAKFIRAKYPSRRHSPLALLYLRRMIDLVRARPGRSEG